MSCPTLPNFFAIKCLSQFSEFNCFHPQFVNVVLLQCYFVMLLLSISLTHSFVLSITDPQFFWGGHIIPSCITYHQICYFFCMCRQEEYWGALFLLVSPRCGVHLKGKPYLAGVCTRDDIIAYWHHSDVIIAIKGYKRGSNDQFFHTHYGYHTIHVKVVVAWHLRELIEVIKLMRKLL